MIIFYKCYSFFFHLYYSYYYYFVALTATWSFHVKLMTGLNLHFSIFNSFGCIICSYGVYEKSNLFIYFWFSSKFYTTAMHKFEKKTCMLKNKVWEGQNFGSNVPGICRLWFGGYLSKLLQNTVFEIDDKLKIKEDPIYKNSNHFKTLLNLKFLKLRKKTLNILKFFVRTLFLAMQFLNITK